MPTPGKVGDADHRGIRRRRHRRLPSGEYVQFPALAWSEALLPVQDGYAWRSHTRHSKNPPGLSRGLLPGKSVGRRRPWYRLLQGAMTVLCVGQRNLAPSCGGFQISWSPFAPKKPVQSVFDTSRRSVKRYSSPPPESRNANSEYVHGTHPRAADSQVLAYLP